MTRSSLLTGNVSTAQWSPRTVTPYMAILHHTATTNLQAVLDMMVSGSREVSAHVVVKDAQRIGVVDEELRAWSLSDAYWDSAAFTVECVNESTNGWVISAASHESLALLVADWAKRYGWWPHRTGEPETWTVIGHSEVNSIHGGSYSTACPGGMNLNWIVQRAQQILIGDPEMAFPRMIPIAKGVSLTGDYLLIGETGRTVKVLKADVSNVKRLLFIDKEPDNALQESQGIELAAKYLGAIAPAYSGGGTPITGPVDVTAASRDAIAAKVVADMPKTLT